MFGYGYLVPGRGSPPFFPYITVSDCRPSAAPATAIATRGQVIPDLISKESGHAKPIRTGPALGLDQLRVVLLTPPRPRRVWYGAKRTRPRATSHASTHQGAMGRAVFHRLFQTLTKAPVPKQRRLKRRRVFEDSEDEVEVPKALLGWS